MYDFETGLIEVVDDGTGEISCILWHSDETGPSKIELGDLCTIIGKLSVYNDELQIAVNSYTVESDSNVELLHWAEVISLKKFVYNTPFDPSKFTPSKTPIPIVQEVSSFPESHLI